MFRRLFDGVRDVARSGSKLGEPQSSTNPASLRGYSLALHFAHRRSATIHGTCSLMDQSQRHAFECHRVWRVVARGRTSLIKR